MAAVLSSVTGSTLEVVVMDQRTGRGASGITCTLYYAGASVGYDSSGNTAISGTPASGLTATGTVISGITDSNGIVILSDILPVRPYTVIVQGAGIATKILPGYTRVVLPPVVFGMSALAPYPMVSVIPMLDLIGLITYTYYSVTYSNSSYNPPWVA